MQGIGLALQCLSFDFVGTCLDESSEDLGTIQASDSWRDTLLFVSTQYFSSCLPWIRCDSCC